MSSSLSEIFKKYEVPETIITRTEKFIGKLREKVQLNKETKVLDLGCGLGCAGTTIINDVKHVTFLDVTEKSKLYVENLMKELQTKNFNYFDKPFEQYNGEKLNLIFSSLAFHHIDDYLSVIHKLSQHLEPNSKVVVLEIVDDKIERPNVPHRGFVPEEFCNEFLKSGFMEAKWEDFGKIDIHGTMHDLFLMVASN